MVMKRSSARRRWTTRFVSAVLLGTALGGFGSTFAATTAGAQSGDLYSWGTFELGQTGSDTPQIVTGVPGTIVQISGSDRDMYALTSAGTVFAWGGEADGALGNNTHGTGFTMTPVQVQFPSGVTIASLPTPMPAMTGMAIDTNGNVWGWGANEGGALCSTVQYNQAPVMITASQLEGDVTLATGQNNFALYYTSTGQLYGCGANVSGQLGDGTFTKSTSPVQVTGLPQEPILSLQSSWENSGALLADGSYWDWGYNANGQLGDGSTVASDVPVQVGLPAKVDVVSLGGSLSDNGQTEAILSNGLVYSWGSDKYGQLGIGTTNNSHKVPVKVLVPTGTTFVSVASGGAAQYAVDSTGDVWAWGENNVGQLGIGNTQNQSLPVSVGVDASQVFSIAFDVASFYVPVTQGSQKITFRPLANQTLAQSPITVTATASSSLPVSFTTTTHHICISSGAYGEVIDLLAVGTCDIVASQPGNRYYLPATRVTRAFKVLPAPVISDVETSPLEYQSQTSPVEVTGALTLNDVGDATIGGATVSVTSGFAAGEDAELFTNQNDITGSYDSTTGVLTLSGDDTIANYQAALCSVEFSTSDSSASPAARVVSFQVTDSDNVTSNTESRTIDVFPAA
jgi:Regulator of chromosome condensation (RCC1) repeat